MNSERSDESGLDDVQALELIQSSGLLNPSFTLEKLLVLTARLAVTEYEGAGDLRRMTPKWVFISRHFVLKGTQA